MRAGGILPPAASPIRERISKAFSHRVSQLPASSPGRTHFRFRPLGKTGILERLSSLLLGS